MNPKLDAGLAARLYKAYWGECAYPFKWIQKHEKSNWRDVATEVRKIVKEATKKGGTRK